MGAVDVTHGHEAAGASCQAAAPVPPAGPARADAGTGISTPRATMTTTASRHAWYLRPPNGTWLTPVPAISRLLTPNSLPAGRPSAMCAHSSINSWHECESQPRRDDTLIHVGTRWQPPLLRPVRGHRPATTHRRFRDVITGSVVLVFARGWFRGLPAIRSRAAGYSSSPCIR